MIVLIGGEKGGTGKSTLATNLAVWLAHSRRDVLLLDADRQGTSANWVSERTEHPELPVVHCVQRYGNIFKAVKDLAERYDDIIIDAGGRDSEELRSAMVAADKLYSPVRASQSDLWTADHLNQLVALARGLNQNLQAYALLSMAPTNPRVNEAAEASEMLAEFKELQLANIVIRDRKVFRDAMVDGRGVFEMSDPKAIEELLALAKEIYGEQVQAEAVC